jgi:uncharacterized protein YbaP (TraB family)
LNINKSFISPLLILVLLAGCSSSNVEKPWSDGKPDNILWQVSDGDSEVFLLGSIHALKDGMYPLDDEILAAFEESEALAVEFDVRNADQMAAAQYMVFQDGRTLDSVLSPEKFREVVDRLISVVPQMNEPMIKMFKPWAAGLTITQMEMMGSGASPENGIDMHFLKKADQRKIGDKDFKIYDMESMEGQLKLFDDMFTGGDEIIDYFLDSSNSGTEFLDEVSSHWEKGDAKAIDKLINGELGKTDIASELKEKLLTTRNKNMTDKVLGYLEENKKVFVVVGAGHLVGDTGIVEMMKNKDMNLNIIKY